MLGPLRVQAEGPKADVLGFWAHPRPFAEPMVLSVPSVFPGWAGSAMGVGFAGSHGFTTGVLAMPSALVAVWWLCAFLLP